MARRTPCGHCCRALASVLAAASAPGGTCLSPWRWPCVHARRLRRSTSNRPLAVAKAWAGAGGMNAARPSRQAAIVVRHPSLSWYGRQARSRSHWRSLPLLNCDRHLHLRESHPRPLGPSMHMFSGGGMVGPAVASCLTHIGGRCPRYPTEKSSAIQRTLSTKSSSIYSGSSLTTVVTSSALTWITSSMRSSLTSSLSLSSSS